MPTDKKIIKRFVEGDAEAFDIVYNLYSRKMFHFATGLLKDREIARDLIQEVFINLWDKRDKIDFNLNFDNYIFTITYNTIRKYLRKKSIEHKAIDYMLKNAPEIIEDTDSALIYNELIEIATRSIESLPPRRRTIYKLSRQEGMKIKEIAERLHISSRTVETQLARALDYLKKELSEISLLSLLFYYLFLN